MTALSDAPVWHAATKPPPLVGDDVHVWRFELDQPDDVRARLEVLLSSDESSRAARFVHPQLRNRFVTSRAFLRLLLATYLDRPAAKIEFLNTPNDKPAVAGGASGIQFNLSHSAALALVAVCRGRPIGVDLECHEVAIDYEELSERFLSPTEAAALQALPSEQRKIGFFTCWTRKEAYVKALGLGLGVPFDSFDVSVIWDQPRLLAARHSGADVRIWQLANIEAGDGYCAALAVRDSLGRIWHGEWSPGLAIMNAVENFASGTKPISFHARPCASPRLGPSP
jgi:4'-phosphopantetheinyl transferase